MTRDEATEYLCRRAGVRRDFEPALQAFAEHIEFGAFKHGAGTWRTTKARPYSDVIGALRRHLRKFEYGEDLDEEGRPHLAAIMFRAAQLYCYGAEGRTDLDDRSQIGARYEAKMAAAVERLCADDWLEDPGRPDFEKVPA
jgi:hypothetical protein